MGVRVKRESERMGCAIRYTYKVSMLSMACPIYSANIYIYKYACVRACVFNVTVYWPDRNMCHQFVPVPSQMS